MVDVAVVLVEDNADHHELIVAALQESCDPQRILAFEDGVEAIDYLLGRGPHKDRDARKQPRLVVLDMKLRRMHGLEVLTAMRDDPLTQSVPVVMLSASSDKEALDSCYEAGANSVVRKSLDHDELRRKMGQMYEFWVNVNEANRNSRV